ncbi:MAG: hypothetical protein AAGF22_01670 [Pseudomonadota bacterium]
MPLMPVAERRLHNKVLPLRGAVHITYDAYLILLGRFVAMLGIAMGRWPLIVKFVARAASRSVAHWLQAGSAWVT